MAGGTGQQKGTNRLTDREIKAFIAATKAGTARTKKLSDGNGLFLMISASGSPSWRVKYRVDGKERLAGPGIYPRVSLTEARAARDKLLAQLRDGLDPSIERVKRSNSSATFRDVAAEWLELRRRDWSKSHFAKSNQALDRDVMPRLGRFRIADITAPVVAPILQAIVGRGSTETASKVLQHVNGIFRYAEGRGLCSGNPAIAAKELIPRRRSHSQRPALLTFEALGDVLRRADVAPISPAVRLAHRLIAFSAARIGNVITAQWGEFDLGDDSRWIIPRAKMKMKDRRHDHMIVLGPTIRNELRAWKSITGGKGFVFPSPAGRAHITHESLEKAYRVTLKLEGQHSPHGWRSSFSTLAKEHGYSREAVELALDHVADNSIVRAYDRGERLEERVRLAVWWDTHLVASQYETQPLSRLSSAVA